MQPPVLVDRPDPIDLMLAQEKSRLDWLLSDDNQVEGSRQTG